MAKVDPEDDTIRRYVVRHYASDPDRHERRHMTVAAFDNEAEFGALFGRLSEELRRRRDDGDEFDQREHYTGVVLEAGHGRLQRNGRLIRDAMAPASASTGYSRSWLCPRTWRWCPGKSRTGTQSTTRNAVYECLASAAS